MAHLKEQSLGRVLVCLLPVRSERSIFNDFFCKSTSQCREFSASPVKGLSFNTETSQTLWYNVYNKHFTLCIPSKEFAVTRS